MEIEFKLCVSIKFEDSSNPNYTGNDKKMDAAMNNILKIVTSVTNGLLAPTASIFTIAEDASINIYKEPHEEVKQG